MPQFDTDVTFADEDTAFSEKNHSHRSSRLRRNRGASAMVTSKELFSPIASRFMVNRNCAAVWIEQLGLAADYLVAWVSG